MEAYAAEERVLQGQAFQADGKLDIARPHNVLHFEVHELGRVAQLGNNFRELYPSQPSAQGGGTKKTRQPCSLLATKTYQSELRSHNLQEIVAGEKGLTLQVCGSNVEVNARLWFQIVVQGRFVIERLWLNGKTMRNQECTCHTTHVINKHI